MSECKTCGPRKKYKRYEVVMDSGSSLPYRIFDNEKHQAVALCYEETKARRLVNLLNFFGIGL